MSETREIEVAGLRVALEQRTCAGGCGKAFWCMPASKQRLARSKDACAAECAGKPWTPALQAQMEAASSTVPKGTRDEMSTEQRNQIKQMVARITSDGCSVKRACELEGLSTPNMRVIVGRAKRLAPRLYAAYQAARTAVVDAKLARRAPADDDEYDAMSPGAKQRESGHMSRREMMPSQIRAVALTVAKLNEAADAGRYMSAISAMLAAGVKTHDFRNALNKMRKWGHADHFGPYDEAMARHEKLWRHGSRRRAAEPAPPPPAPAPPAPVAAPLPGLPEHPAKHEQAARIDLDGLALEEAIGLEAIAEAPPAAPKSRLAADLTALMAILDILSTLPQAERLGVLRAAAGYHGLSAAG